MSSNLTSKEKTVVEYIEGLNSSYTSSPVYCNWQKLCDNIMDAANQQYRPGEQLTRQGMYFGVMRAQRDGWRDGGLEIFGQANPLFNYRPRRNVSPFLADRAQEVTAGIWKDIGGLLKWQSLWNDGVDYGMAIAYTKYCKYHGEYEKPVVENDVYIERLEWRDEYDELSNSPDFMRVHPYNYRCAVGGGIPEWEMLEWEWSVADLKGMIGDKTYNQAAVKRLIERMQKGEIGSGGANHYYNHAQTKFGEAAPTKRVYARELWGRLSGAEGFEGDAREWVAITCEGELLRWQHNKLRIGRTFWRPIKRIRLDPMNDLPYGGHVLAPTLPHQRMKNLMHNLAADDLVIRQHLGLVVWPGALMNLNALMNPEGAREPIFMRGDANVNQIPRFFADQSSGVVRDIIQFDTSVIEKDMAISGLPLQSLGYGGGAQGKTATEQNYLANSSSRKMKAAIVNATESGLNPIITDMLGLYLRNNMPADLGLSPQEQFEIFQNNFFDFESTLMINMGAQSQALATWGNVAMQKMSEITPLASPGSADHVVQYLKDMGKAMGLSSVMMDTYLPSAPPVQIPQGQQPPAGMPPAQQPPMPGPQPSPEEMMTMEAANVA